MRGILFLGSVSFVSALLGGCGDDKGPLFIETGWRVRCPEGSSGCPTDEPSRMVFNVDGEDGHQLECNVIDVDDNRMVLNWRAAQGSAFAIELRNATFSKSGGNLMGQGTILAEEGDNKYEGAVGAGTISMSQPCRAEQLDVGKDDNGDPQLSGQILCQRVQNETAQELTRDITAPGDAREFRTMPFFFRLVNCSGL